MAKYLVLGKGKSGEAAASVLRAQGHVVDFAEGYQGVILSPGVPAKSELQLGCEELKRRGWKLLAVTGSKGKSSVVKIVADALNLAGVRAVPCGNYGRPVSDLIEEPSGWAIVEVSSFQLETTTLSSETFEGAVVLNLQEDHLDRHGGLDVYHALKRKLLTFAKRSFMPSPSQVDASVEAILAGSYFDNEILRANGVAACWLMSVAGLTEEAMRRAFATFAPLAHRMNLVAERNGVRFIDDSKATSLAALAAGVTMAAAKAGREVRSVRLIAGGLPKGDDPKSVCPILTKRVKKVYLIGQSAEAFSSAWKDVTACEICGTLDRAVASALCEAEKGETVLLSPGTASFDQFRSFEERGEVFARLVKKER